MKLRKNRLAAKQKILRNFAARKNFAAKKHFSLDLMIIIGYYRYVIKRACGGKPQKPTSRMGHNQKEKQMAKFTYKEIKEIIKNTPAELSGKDFYQSAHHNYIDLGAFWKHGANWAYQVKAIVWDGKPELVVVVFGQIQ